MASREVSLSWRSPLPMVLVWTLAQSTRTYMVVASPHMPETVGTGALIRARPSRDSMERPPARAASKSRVNRSIAHSNLGADSTGFNAGSGQRLHRFTRVEFLFRQDAPAVPGFPLGSDWDGVAALPGSCSAQP